jgi:uncharacterized protein (DUF2249 family)
MGNINDFRDLPPATRRQRLLSLFNDLPRGQGFILRSDNQQNDLLELLQHRFSGTFEWHPLVDGPDEWRIIVSRRDIESDRPLRRNVLEFMTSDHQRIHRMLERLGELARNGEHKQLTEETGHLATSLRKHVAMEEELLFPVISESLGTLRGPSAVLRDEHIQIFNLIESIQRTAATDGYPSLVEQLEDLLVNHSGIEERILYAITDLLLTEQERDELVKRCQRL